MNKYISIRNRSGSISFQIHKKTVVALLLLISCSLFIFIMGLSIGSTLIHPLTIIKHLLGMESSEHAFTIDTLRLPRMILTLLVGAALAVSGVILQGIVRNPLASPDIIGITGGASAAAVLFISYLPDTKTPAGISKGIKAVLPTISAKHTINPPITAETGTKAPNDR